MPEPWATILEGLTSEFGVIIAMGAVIFFLWRLYREEQRDRKSSDERMDNFAVAITGLTEELRARRRS